MSNQQRHFDGTHWWTWNGTEWVLDQVEPESPEAARRRKRLPFIVIPLVLLAFLAFFAWPRPTNKLNLPPIRTVVYEVEGTADSVDITIATPTGIEQKSGLSVPLKRKSDGKRGLQLTFTSGSFVSISAQNQGDFGTVTCRITVDGVVVSENTASGAYTIASCDGRA